MLSRRSFLTASTAAASVRSVRAASRPNILWVSCEDTGPQIGCYGDKAAVTPNVDRLAAEGVRYTHAYTVAGVCAPSRSGIITGMYPTTLGSQYMRCSVALPDFVKCFPEYLREAGYYCTNNSKTDYNFPVPPNAWDESSDQAHWNKGPKDRPFFSVFNYTVTHEGQIRLRGQEHERNVRRLKPSERRDPSRLALPPYYPDTPETRRDWANYYECITAMDYLLGDRLREIESAGLLDNTIVFFWGDHGVGLPRAKRWLYESSTHVPLVIRIPERLRVAGQARPASVDAQLVSFIDLAPTVLNLAGVPLAKPFQGRAFLGPNLTPPRNYVFGARDRMDERYDSVRMVRDARYRYLRNYHTHRPYTQHTAYMEVGNTMKELRRLQAEGRLPDAAKLYMGSTKPAEELYDTEHDYHELRNLAGSPEHQSVLRRLRSVQEEWTYETRDVGLLPEPEVEERGKALGTRYAIFRQNGSVEEMRRLRTLIDAVNRNEKPELVREALGSPDAAMRYWAMIGLTRNAASTAAVKEQVTEAMRTDGSAVVRIAAAEAAARHLKSGEAVPVLVGYLKDANEYVRLHALQAIDTLGAEAGGARDAVQAFLTGKPSEYTRRVAEHILSQIG